MSITTDYLTTVYDVKKFQTTASLCLTAAETMMTTHPLVGA